MHDIVLMDATVHALYNDNSLHAVINPNTVILYSMLGLFKTRHVHNTNQLVYAGYGPVVKNPKYNKYK